ncbi:MAG TPA: endonuclease/exonuclease/phosphatase family protein [Polyangiaceae bacterium]|nr:endonuclease/exonuclease/phosphatase family protein [Polyangiaceae bacterium]
MKLLPTYIFVLSLAACSSEPAPSPTPDASGGSAGTPAAGGSAGAPSAGTGGSAAGSGGSAGTATGGAGGATAGSAGQAGSAGTGGGSEGGAGGAEGGPDLAIMTFNIRYGTADDGDNAWPLRKYLVFEIIRDKLPDSMGLQEALLFQLEELDAEFPEYDRVGVGRNDGVESGEFAAIMYKTEKLEVLDSGTFWFSDTPDEIGSIDWEASLPRICSWAHFQEKATGRSYYHYNIHIDNASELARVNSVKLLMSRVVAREVTTDPVIVTGDFNTGEASVPIQFMKGATTIDDSENPLPLLDSFRVVDPDETMVGTFSEFTGVSDGEKIDYIFTDTLQAIEAEIIHDNDAGRYPSDHFPVRALFDGSTWQ